LDGYFLKIGEMELKVRKMNTIKLIWVYLIKSLDLNLEVRQNGMIILKNRKKIMVS
jgi:hypothetical protein